MRKPTQSLVCIALLLTALVLGAPGPCQEPIKPCFEGEIPFPLPPEVEEFIDSIAGCWGDEVCNGALTFYEECRNIIGPPGLCKNIERLIENFGEEYPFLYEIGTCRLPGEEGYPCAEDDDCAGGVCTEGYCE